MIHRATAENAEQVARLLRTRGRLIITAPPRSGRTTELLKYAEERFPDGRFVVVAPEESHAHIIHIHWREANGIGHVQEVAAALRGEKLQGESVNPPRLIYPEMVWSRVIANTTPVFVDGWNSLTEEVKKEILKHRFFVAAIA